MYIAPGYGADNPLQTKCWCEQKGLITLPICCKFQINLFEDWFYTRFNDFIHVCSLRAGADNHLGTKVWCQQKGLITAHLLRVKKKTLFEVWFYTHFFMILYSPGQGQTTHWGQNVDVNRKALSRFPFVASLKKSLWTLILYILFMLLYMYIALVQGQTTPWGHYGQHFDVNRNILSLWSFVVNFFHKLSFSYFSWRNVYFPI